MVDFDPNPLPEAGEQVSVRPKVRVDGFVERPRARLREDCRAEARFAARADDGQSIGVGQRLRLQGFQAWIVGEMQRDLKSLLLYGQTPTGATQLWLEAAI